MPRFLCKVNAEGRDFYFEFSTIVDAPVTFGMSLEEFTDYYKTTYGTHGMHEFAQRMQRVEAKGTSAYDYDSVEDLLRFNRAGNKETQLTLAQLIDAYCLNTEWAECETEEEEKQGKECPIVGTTHGDENEDEV